MTMRPRLPSQPSMPCRRRRAELRQGRQGVGEQPQRRAGPAVVAGQRDPDRRCRRRRWPWPCPARSRRSGRPSTRHRAELARDDVAVDDAGPGRGQLAGDRCTATVGVEQMSAIDAARALRVSCSSTLPVLAGSAVGATRRRTGRARAPRPPPARRSTVRGLGPRRRDRRGRGHRGRRLDRHLPGRAPRRRRSRSAGRGLHLEPRRPVLVDLLEHRRRRARPTCSSRCSKKPARRYAWLDGPQRTLTAAEHRPPYGSRTATTGPSPMWKKSSTPPTS